jgi:hypothetical protein
VNLVSAFNSKSKRVKKQVLLEVNIGCTKLDQVVLLSAQLLTETIIGLDFLLNYEAEIRFSERRITHGVNEEVFNFNSQALKKHQLIVSVIWDLSIYPQTQHPSTAYHKGHCYTKNFATAGVDESVQDRKRVTGTCMEDSEYLLEYDKECECLLNDDDNEASIQQRIRNCAEHVIAAKHERGCRFCRKSFATFAEVKESQNTDSLVADKHELI